MTYKVSLPAAGIVLLVGPSNSGKTTILQQLIRRGILKSSEVVSSDQFRLMLGDTNFIEWGNRPKDEANVLQSMYQNLSKKAFDTMDAVIETRSQLGKLTVVDATHLHTDDRLKYIELAKKNHVPIIAIVLNVPEQILLERDAKRENPRGKKRIKQQCRVFQRNLRSVKKEGFIRHYVLTDKELENCQVVRLPHPLELELGSGIDFIGDVHGCYDELLELLAKLGYEENEDGLHIHPTGRKFVSLGDVMSRGPHSIDSMIFFKKHVDAGLAYMIDSNHGWKIARWLDGRNVTLQHGDEKVAEEFAHYEKTHGEDQARELKKELKDFLLKAPSHYVFLKNGVRVVVATHAGIKDVFIGKQSHAISDFCRYGETDGLDERGKPIRKDWYTGHKSSELIVWGHDPKPQPLLINNTINIDQGAVFGGSLTAFRYPEKTFVSVKAKQDYSGDLDHPLKQWKKKRLDPPNIAHLLSGISVLTEQYGEIKVRADVVKSAIDSISHVTVPIEELIYIPPTMSPTPETSALDSYLEHPEEAFHYYRSNGVQTLVAEKKHMGSRGILLLFKNEEAAVKYTGYSKLGTIYTRTGRPFFDPDTEQQLLEKLNHDLTTAGYFNRYETDFVLLDAEIMPWNLKAKELISSQYAHVAEMAIIDRLKLKEQLVTALENGRDTNAWLAEVNVKLKNASVFNQVFQNYCWSISSIADIEIAPFHTLAHSGETFFHKSHLWHMEKNREFSSLSDVFIETDYRLITDEHSEREAIHWWEEITEDGHEGFVVKPEAFVARNDREKLLQPAIKVRGRKYLHLIYGMDYLLPENLVRLKKRNVNKKQRHALMEFALGMEAIQRFVNNETVERIHECVLATLSLEAEPVDPRL